MLVEECMIALLFPFQWTLLDIPIDFTTALIRLDAPVPAIKGIKTTDRDPRSLDEPTSGVQRCVV